MASVVEVYKAAAYSIHQTQNGELTYTDFNLQSKLAEIRMLGWLTGNPSVKQQPTPYDSQKSRSWLSPVLIPYKANVIDGKLAKPADFYYYDNMYSLELVDNTCEDDEQDVQPTIKKIPVELLQGQQFTVRQKTYIKALKPSAKKPIAKEVGLNFEFDPEDLGGVALEYISYPAKYGEIVPMIDPVYNDEVPNPALSQDYVWGDWAIEILAWFITDNFANHTRDTMLKQFNAATGKVAV